MAKATKSAIKTLRLRMQSYRAELSTCTTAAMKRCVMEQMETTASQLLAAERSREPQN
jgi:sulfur relay (sulfurtransferase) complex TusBCD TusD component (DsrE family)